jgi:hypothetical protein
MGICPDMKIISPYCIAWLYGPMGAGALSVRIIFFSISQK